MALLDRIAFRWRTRAMSHDLDVALAARRRDRPARHRSAIKGWATRSQRQMEGLKR